MTASIKKFGTIREQEGNIFIEGFTFDCRGKKITHAEIVQLIAERMRAESGYITAEQARELGVGNAEFKTMQYPYLWKVCGSCCAYEDDYQYRAIKQAQPEPRQDTEMRLANEAALAWEKLYPKEPVDKHAALRAEYIRQRDAVPCELGFFKWEFQNTLGSSWVETKAHNRPAFYEGRQYRFTDISCHVSKDGEPAIRMLRTEAQALQCQTKDTHDWFDAYGLLAYPLVFTFNGSGIYTYKAKAKATIELDGKMVTREQAAAEWGSKKKTHVMWFKFSDFIWTDVIGLPEDYVNYFMDSCDCKYELRPKQSAWTGSREDVLALLKETGLL